MLYVASLNIARYSVVNWLLYLWNHALAERQDRGGRCTSTAMSKHAYRVERDDTACFEAIVMCISSAYLARFKINEINNFVAILYLYTRFYFTYLH